MRGDAALTARLLLRGAGLAGLVAVLGGVVMVVGALRAWAVAIAEVAMLGAIDDRAVATLRGVPGTAGGWVVAGLGLLVVGLGGALALDRPPRHARVALVAAALVAAALAVTALALPPDPGRIAGREADELSALRERLPTGVELELHATSGPGPWWVLAGAVLAVGGGLRARDR